jgi:hypothetical protein
MTWIDPSRTGVRAAMHAWLGVLLLVNLSACEEDVTAVVGTDLPYSLYGVLSPQLDSQWVRVYPIEGRLTPAEPEPIDAVVTSTNLTTGEQIEWRDSIIVDFANQFAHVFWAPFEAEFGHTYRIEARRSDGRSTHVDATVPPVSEIMIEPAQIRSDGVVLPVLISGDVPRVLRVEVDYAVVYRTIGAPNDVSDRVVIEYNTEPQEVEEGWRVPINLREDYEEVVATLVDRVDESIDSRVGIILLNMTIRLIVGNQAWSPPNDVFDAEILVQPGVMTNVESGFGFVGAGYRMSHLWIPPGEAAERAGFRPPSES